MAWRAVKVVGLQDAEKKTSQTLCEIASTYLWGWSALGLGLVFEDLSCFGSQKEPHRSNIMVSPLNAEPIWEGGNEWLRRIAVLRGRIRVHVAVDSSLCYARATSRVAGDISRNFIEYESSARCRAKESIVWIDEPSVMSHQICQDRALLLTEKAFGLCYKC
ncbi:hypothetical protein M406DRAFT_325595 [Cryphonectria parasitica EP155]|uniref:Uncharacterized protein n=1 Tax=Cryphonectria parasitica (strain ATCC 38755 / EP155) TaxID=660469 RepID=A0A9P4YB73_CRYP1|nr:uncharacterized protein M406DRAFT_325595 [Cryphonectria parasitica EP155]KAF3770128.1 hypothetical protein M406DRAFT_325595 [Cryphonectria parasitica EP155]